MPCPAELSRSFSGHFEQLASSLRSCSFARHSRSSSTRNPLGTRRDSFLSVLRVNGGFEWLLSQNNTGKTEEAEDIHDPTNGRVFLMNKNWGGSRYERKHPQLFWAP